MTVRRLALFVLALAACDSGRNGHGPNSGDGGTAMSGNIDPTKDSDGDGYSAVMGDCDDTSPLIGPNSVEVAGNGIDDDCDGQVDNAAPCDTSVAGMKTPEALAQAMGFCASKFLTSAKMVGPSDMRARNTVKAFGILKPLEGAAMSFISSGEATTDPSYDPQQADGLGVPSFDSPYKTIPAPPANGCGSGPPPTVNDYTELSLELKVPYNANSLSFQFQFFSAEYPEFVCTQFNDRFLVILDDNTGQPQNIAFDNQKNAISVNNGFFTICKNDNTKPQTQHCTHPVSDIMGTGYDKATGGTPEGGSTGWLTTTAPVTPGDKIKLRFIIFDEGDDILDSAALIDNFQWLTNKVDGPVTVQ